MKIHLLLGATLLTAACGAHVVTPVPPADAASDGTASQDVAPPPPPPPVDASIPPIDVNTPPIPTLCARVCTRLSECGSSSSNCASECERASGDNGGRCLRQFTAFLQCIATQGVVCSGGNPQPTAACQAVFRDYQTCAGSTPPPPPPPPPPVDAGIDDAERLCTAACERQVSDCRRGSTGCVPDCLNSRAMVGRACVGAFDAVAVCVVRNGWICTSGDLQPSSVCQSALNELMRCVGGTPPPPVDAGTEPVYPGCVTACMRASSACGTMDPSCVSGCSRAGTTLPTRCRPAFDRFLTCVDRNGFTCEDGRPQPSTRCDADMREVSMCAMSGGGTTPSDAGVAPPPDV